MSDGRTLLLTRPEVGGLLDRRAVLEAVRAGFAARAAAPGGAIGQRIPVALPDVAPPGASGMLLAPGFVPGIPAYTVKVHSKFPGSAHAIKGVIVLHALDDGRVLAIVESTLATAARTAAAGALGAAVLARPDATVAAIVGCGVQGRAQLEALLDVRPIRRVLAVDADPARAAAFAADAAARLRVEAMAMADPGRAAAQADVVVTATWSTEPFLDIGDVRAGTHLTTLGPDQPGKRELSADLIRASRFVADDRRLQVAMGAIGGVGLGEDAVAAEIGAVLAGDCPGREAADQITVYGSVGLPFQDLVVAWYLYGEARNRGVGTWIDLMGGEG